MTDAVKDNDEPGADEETVTEPMEETVSDLEEEEVGVPDGTEAEADDDRSPAGASDGHGSAGDGHDGAATDPLAILQGEYDTLNDRHLRLAAEFNNFRRRSEQERLGAWSRAQADLVEKFLDVLDDLHRVAELDLSNATVEAIMEGIDLVERKFVRVLGDADVEMIDPAGEPFDPELMEAMMRVPAETEEQDDTVAQVFQKGYALKGVLIRPARVSVYSRG